MPLEGTFIKHERVAGLQRTLGRHFGPSSSLGAIPYACVCPVIWLMFKLLWTVSVLSSILPFKSAFCFLSCFFFFLI